MTRLLSPGRIYDLAALRGGYQFECDAIVVGSGPGGFVTADNLAAAGMKVALVEAGPLVTPDDMNVEAPHFLAKYYWEGGLRLVRGSSPNPAMSGRCLGGSTVVNSAIMLPLPEWVRQEWADGDGLHDLLEAEALKRSFERIFARTHTAPTPMTVLGKRNLLVKSALEAAGMKAHPLPRAVKDCEGCASCITGCHEHRKQSVDIAYKDAFLANGGTIFTCSEVERVLTKSGKALGVTGQVVDIDGWQRVGRFEIRAPRVFMAAGVAHTPAILMASGLSGGGLVGSTLEAHITGGGVAIMDEVVDPWHGATQGVGAFSDDIKGMKYEALWAAPSLISVNWGGLGHTWLKDLQSMRHAACFALVYKAKVSGQVKRGLGRLPSLHLHIPQSEIRVLMRGLKRIVDGFLDIGARHVHTTTSNVPAYFHTKSETEALLSPKVKASDCHMTFNHMFGSCRLSSNPRRGPVDASGRLRGVDGVWVTDASLFPAPSAVNPQATIMVLADLISRKAADLPV